MSFFNRSYEVTFLSGTQSVTFSDLQVRFRIERDREDGSDSLMLEVVNLDESTRRFIVGDAVSVLLAAGYKGAESIVYQGDILTRSLRRTQTDIIVLIEAGDGASARGKAIFNGAFQSGTPVARAFEAVGDQLGSRVVFDAQPDGAFSRQWAFSGSAHQAMRDLCASHELKYHVIDGVVRVHSNNPRTLFSVYKITPTSGLVGDIEKTDAGVAVTSLMIPSLRPGDLIEVESPSLRVLMGARKIKKLSGLDSGLFTIDSMEVIGDYLGGEWISRMECALETR